MILFFIIIFLTLKMASLTEECCICYEDILPKNSKYTDYYKCNGCKNVTCIKCLTEYIKLKNIKCFGGKECNKLLEYKSNLPPKIKGNLLERLAEKHIDDLDVQYLQQKISIDKQTITIKNVCSDIDKQIRALKEEKRKNLDMLKNLNKRALNRSNVICRCPKERCLGIITDKDNKCALCNYEVCKNCWQEKEEEHECNKDTIETIKHIKSNTQICPKCTQRIHKIAGCDHMFCTECHTSFYYSSGLEFDHTKNTNPEYFNFLRTYKGKEKFGLTNNVGDHNLPLNQLIRQILTHMTTTRCKIALPIEDYPKDEFSLGDIKLYQKKILEGYHKFSERHRLNAFHDELESILHHYNFILQNIDTQINDRENDGHIMESIGKKYLINDKDKKNIITQFKTNIKRKGLFNELKIIHEKYFSQVSKVLNKHCKTLGNTYRNLIDEIGEELTKQKTQNIETQTLIELLNLRKEMIPLQKNTIKNYYSKISDNYNKYLLIFESIKKYYNCNSRNYNVRYRRTAVAFRTRM